MYWGRKCPPQIPQNPINRISLNSPLHQLLLSSRIRQISLFKSRFSQISLISSFLPKGGTEFLVNFHSILPSFVGILRK
jgi:hypothetical protein